MPAWWSSIDVLSRISSTTQLICAVLFVLTAAVALLTVTLSHRLHVLRAETERQLHERLQLAQAALERLQPAPDTTPGSVAARKESASSASPSLPPTSAGPRHFTPDQRERFVSSLKKGKVRGRVGLLTVMGDSEARRFAGEVERLLREAGLETDGVAQAVFPRGVPRGLLLRLRHAQAAPPQAAALQLAFQAIGLSAPGVASVQEPAHSVTLIVGAKPEPPGPPAGQQVPLERQERDVVRTQPIERLVDDVHADALSSREPESDSTQ